MNRIRLFWLLVLMVLGLGASCSDDQEDGDTGVDADVEEPGDVVVDPSPPDTDAAEDTPDTATDSDACQVVDQVLDGEPEEFDIRVPQERTVTCIDFEENSFEMTFYDQDMVCRFQYECVIVDLYLQATPTGCVSTGFPYPSFEEEGSVQAWIRVGLEVTETTAAYNYGGNHNNDWFSFSYDGDTFRMSHSSIGCGGRACQPPDCLQVCAPQSTCATEGDVTFDGCEREPGDGPPPLPGVCVRVNSDGSVPPLLDPWIAHTQDTNYPVLPCPCDFGSL